MLAVIFEYTPIITKGSRFTNLNFGDKLLILKAWSINKFGVKRDFIKFFKTVILFSFHDHPLVHEKFGIDLMQRTIPKIRVDR